MRINVCCLPTSDTRRCYLRRSRYTRLLLLTRLGLLNSIQHLRTAIQYLALAYVVGFH